MVSFPWRPLRVHVHCGRSRNVAAVSGLGEATTTARLFRFVSLHESAGAQAARDQAKVTAMTELAWAWASPMVDWCAPRPLQCLLERGGQPIAATSIATEPRRFRSSVRCESYAGTLPDAERA